MVLEYDGSDKLYYYCSSATLLSILSGTIWLTDLKQSNDSAEGLHADEMYRYAMTVQLSTFISPAERLFRQHFISGLIETRAVLGMCLSNSRDLLSQWRGYGDDGRGACIAFKREGLLDVVKTNSHVHPNIGLFLVEYDPLLIALKMEEVQNSLRSIFGCSSFKELNDITIDDIHNFIGTKLDSNETSFSNILNILFSCKSIAFSEECEERLLLVCPDETAPGFRFRESAGVISLVCEIKFPREIISDVTMGPRNPTSKSEFTRAVLRHCPNSKVYESKSTYVRRGS